MPPDPRRRLYATFVAVTIIAVALMALLFRSGADLKPVRGGAFELDVPSASSASRANE
jgi:hypothetical protein